MPELETVTLSDLPDRPGDTQAVVVRSVTAATHWLRKGHAVTAAGSTGCINVWKDDEGWWRCEFQRHFVTLGRGRYQNLAAVLEWLKEWLPKMGR